MIESRIQLYLLIFSFDIEAAGGGISRFVVSPSDRAEVVRHLVESVGGSLECYYWMFGQYDGMAVFEMPDAETTAATILAIVSSGAFTRFETHELIAVSDLTSIAKRARGIAYQPPGGWQANRPSDTSRGVNPVPRRPR